MQTADWIAEFPFTLSLMAGAVAYAGALLLRRGLALATDGRVPDWPAAVLRSLGLASVLASFVWAWTLRPSVGPSGVITSMGTYSPAALARTSLTPAVLALTVGSGLLILGGLALAMWALMARLRNGTYGRSPDRLAEWAPYRVIRRPLTLGSGLALLGATLLAGTLAAWACLILAAVLVCVLQEFDDRELRSRVAWVTEQHRRIPRLIPRRLPRRARQG
jgi:protein-S-isoprenylcysteine O-methyltransferase Ste14